MERVKAGRDAKNYQAETIIVFENQPVNGASGRDASDPDAPAPATNFNNANITPNDGFRGRADQLVDLHCYFADPRNLSGEQRIRGHRVVVGEGGMGKSQLVQRYAEDHAGDWDGRWWIDASPDLHAFALRELAKFLNLNAADNASETDLRAAIRSALYGDKRHLIILDSFGHADPARPRYDLLKELDPGPPSCLLITTRDQFVPDQFGPHLNLPVLSPGDAVALIRRDTPRLQDGKDAGKDAALRQDIEDLCEHLGRHAQAVDLAGAWLKLNKGVSPKALLATLKTSDAATIALFEAAALYGQTDRYAVSVGKSLSLHLPRFKGTDTLKVLEAVAYPAPDNIPSELLARMTKLSISQVQDSLRDLAAVSILWSLEGGEHGMARVHRLTQMVLRVLLNPPPPAPMAGDGGRGGGPGTSDGPPLADYLRVLRDDFADVARHERYLERTRLWPHAESLLGHADGSRGGPEVERAASQLRAEVALHLHVLGQLPIAIRHINAAIDYELRQTPVDARSIAILRANRANIRRDQGDPAGALEDVTFSIDWFESHPPRNEREIAIDRASRASIRQDQGDLKGALEDITFSLAWFETNLPGDARSIGILRSNKAAIEAALGK